MTNSLMISSMMINIKEWLISFFLIIINYIEKYIKHIIYIGGSYDKKYFNKRITPYNWAS